MTPTEDRPDPGNWFIHQYLEDHIDNGAHNKHTWVVSIDHSWHAGELPKNEKQRCPEQKEDGGYATLDEAIAELRNLMMGSEIRALPWKYVHLYKDGTFRIDTVFCNTTLNGKHCPTEPGNDTPVTPGYAFNATTTINNVVACMKAGRCPPCPKQ